MKSPACAGLSAVGAPRFELGTSGPPDKRANQAAPRPGRRSLATAARALGGALQRKLCDGLTPSDWVAVTSRKAHALWIDGEAEHHSAFVVLGDVTVRHPAAGLRDLQQNVDGLPGGDEHGVLPDEVRLDSAVAGEDQ